MNGDDVPNEDLGEPLPYSGFRHYATHRRFEEVIVFVHHFGGSPLTMTRHLKMASELGCDSVAFQLKFNDLKLWSRPPFTRHFRFGVREVWAEQITDILNRIPGPKILFTLSSPSSAALLSMVERQCRDIKAWICDGGPFAQLSRCLWNLFKFKMVERNLFTRTIKVAFAHQVLGGYNYIRQSRAALAKLPPQFPILSIRSWNDQLVPMQAIEEFFALHKKLNIEVLSLPEIDHLQGLSRATDIYCSRVNGFIKRVTVAKDSFTKILPTSVTKNH